MEGGIQRHKKLASYLNGLIGRSYGHLLKHRRFHSLIQIYKVLQRISPLYLFHLFHYARDVTTRQGRNPHCLFCAFCSYQLWQIIFAF